MNTKLQLKTLMRKIHLRYPGVEREEARARNWAVIL
jgi:hypothetical protein